MKAVNFSETIAASDLKVGRYRQLIKLKKICEYSRSGSFLDLGPRLLYPPQTVFVGGYTLFTLSERTNERPTDRPTEHVSVMFCFLNNFKNH